MENDTIRNLREALNYSPGNIPLQLHLAETLFNLNQPAEAEAEFKSVLANDEFNSRAKFGLAKIYYRQGKFSTASVILGWAFAKTSDPVFDHLSAFIARCL